MCGRIYGVLAAKARAREKRQAASHDGVPFPHPALESGKSVYLHQHGMVFREDELLVREYGEDSWQVRGYRLLHTHWVMLLLAFLMILDILFMVTDLVLSAFYPHCSVIIEMCACEVAGNSTQTPPHAAVLAAAAEEGQCIEHCVETNKGAESAMLALTICSLIILTLFLIELLFHLVIIGPVRFLLNYFLVIDIVIVLVSIGLEAYLLAEELSHKEPGTAVEAATVPLIIVARSWRLLRIGHGAYKEAHDFYGERVRVLEDKNEELQEQLFYATRGNRGSMRKRKSGTLGGDDGDTKPSTDAGLVDGQQPLNEGHQVPQTLVANT